jgi:hypothetical protein
MLVGAMLLTTLACTHAEVQTRATYGGPLLPAPNRIAVSYFAVSSNQVRLDQGLGPRLMRGAGGSSSEEQQTQAAEDAQAALTQQLVARLRSYGLPAEPGSAVPGADNTLIIDGQILGIDEGNRTRRVVLGFGAGQSKLSANAQLYYVTPEGARFLTAFDGEANSGHAPGAAGTMGAGAVGERLASSAAISGTMHAGIESRKTSAEAEADELADALAKRVGLFAAAQGWIPETAVH